MKYSVSLSGYASKAVHVEAENPDEARVQAVEEAYVSLCHQCAHQVDVGDEWEPTAVLDESGATVWEEGPALCPRGHGVLENGDCPDCGYAT